MSKNLVPSSENQNLSTQMRARVEAERRARFVRGMGGSLVGYFDGYADGFEHAVAWMFEKLGDPLAVEYRPDSGMNAVKNYYKNYPKERRRALKGFEKASSTPGSVK